MSGISPNTPPTNLRFAAYNVETLGEVMDRPGVVSSVDKAKQKEVAETIKEMNADIVAMEEVPSEKTLDEFVNENLKAEYPYKQFFQTNDTYNHHMAILSKYPIMETASNKTRPLQGLPVKHELHLGNLSSTVDKEKLGEIVSKFGEIKSMTIKEKEGKPGSEESPEVPATRFAFVEMATDEQVKAAITVLNGQELDGQKLEVSESKQSNKPKTFLRDVAEAKIDVGGFPLGVYVVHYKADPYFARPTTPEITELARKTREAEAQETRNIVAEDMKRLPTMQYIVAGDMNTTSDDRAIQTLKAPGAASLVDPMENRTGPEYISHPVTNQRIDYALISPGMAKGVKEAGVHHSDHANKASDHLPVFLAFDLGEIRGES
ncbi:MAG: endonuclease/exonuclease/phosphatase family protein [Vulcanimicrobiota bacterium]